MKNLPNLKIKIFPFTISFLGLLLLPISITSCSSNTPTDEIPPVAEDVRFINNNSRKNWRDNSERYLISVKESLYEGDIANLIIESNQGKASVVTVDEEFFLIQSCEYGNQQACEFIKSQPNQF